MALRQILKQLVKTDIPQEWLTSLVKFYRWPTLIGVALVGLHLLLPQVITHLPSYAHILEVVRISMITWLVAQGVSLGRELLINNLKLRGRLDRQRIITQVSILTRIALIICSFVGIALIIITFPHVRDMGLSILTSAGILGVVLAFAAQKSLGSIFAGIQIAFTQPMKIGDKVIIENELGIIEEINLTYVVVRTKLQTQLIVPITYFTERAFHNWSRGSTNTLEIINLAITYDTSLPKLRETFESLLSQTEFWDKRFKKIQITNIRHDAVDLRILVSADSVSKGAKLNSYLKENVLTALQDGRLKKS